MQIAMPSVTLRELSFLVITMCEQCISLVCFRYRTVQDSRQPGLGLAQSASFICPRLLLPLYPCSTPVILLTPRYLNSQSPSVSRSLYHPSPRAAALLSPHTLDEPGRKYQHQTGWDWPIIGLYTGHGLRKNGYMTETTKFIGTTKKRIQHTRVEIFTKETAKILQHDKILDFVHQLLQLSHFQI